MTSQLLSSRAATTEAHAPTAWVQQQGKPPQGRAAPTRHDQRKPMQQWRPSTTEK